MEKKTFDSNTKIILPKKELKIGDPIISDIDFPGLDKGLEVFLQEEQEECLYTSCQKKRV